MLGLLNENVFNVVSSL